MRLEVEKGFFKFNKDEFILKDINFSLEDSNILSVLGPNGVGKTTLIKCITGLLKWSSGKTLINKKDIKNINTKKLWSEISYIPQKRNFVFAYTGLEMVILGKSSKLNAFETPSKKDRDDALEIMKRIGIEKLSFKSCNEMSGGELQMVLIARALVNNPKIIILDEPESGLDFKNQIIILDLIEKLAREGTIVIINTHYPEHALKISDKCLLLKYGGEYKFGDTREILNKENIKSAFEVNVEIKNININGKNYESIITTGLAEM